MNCSNKAEDRKDGGPTNSAASSPDLSKLKPDCFVPSALNPILSRDSGFPGSDWNDPSVLKVDGQYVMFASSDQNFDINVSIYRLTSADGVTWALNPSTPVLSADSNPSAWDHKSVETPSVVHFKGMYHLFYTGYPADHMAVTTYKIGHATSSDGIHWTKDAGFLLAPTDPNNSVPNHAFNQYIVAEPGAVVYNEKIYLYFSALGAHANVGTLIHTIGLTTSSDGQTWSSPQMVLFPDQSIYPYPTWKGFSTPSAVVLADQLHLFYDVVQSNPWKQLRIHHSHSPNGISAWTTDMAPIFSYADFSWTAEEIRSPALFLNGKSLLMWFAGHNSVPTLGIGYAHCEL